VSVRVVAHTESLNSIEQLQVMASDVLILCQKYELWFVLGTLPGVTECGPEHIFSHVFYKLWLVGGGKKMYLEVII